MNENFYCLSAPYSNKPYRVYGKPEWERQFGLAEWGEAVKSDRIKCPVDPGHPLFGDRRTDLTLILPSLKIGDFVWTWNSDCIITEHTLSRLREAGFTGFEVRPVAVERVKGRSAKLREELIISPLWELVVVGKGGDAAPESGIHMIDHCDGCGRTQYSSFHNGILVNENHWDGSDFFTVNGYPKYVLVTKNVKDLIVSQNLTNCALIPSHELEWGSSTRPEDFLEEMRTLASRDLRSLVVDLDSEDTGELMKTINALGEKRDHRAVDPLMERFSHPHGLIREAAASAVARIGGHRDTSEQAREDTFAKLSNLINHEDPFVRMTAAAACGDLGGERAGEQVMRLLSDPEEMVRNKAVFVLGFLMYEPALEAIKRLLRDPSPAVREQARWVVKELSNDLL